MASLEEELLLDAAEDARAVAFIRSRLPQEMQQRVDEEAIYYFIDLIVEYYAESGILDQIADNDGYVDIDLEEVADNLYKKSRKEGFSSFSAEDILLIVEAYFDFEESLEG